MADDSTNKDGRNKRPRRSTSRTTSSTQQRKKKQQQCHVVDLPDGLLEVISTFLPGPSRALFAVAVTFPSLTARKGKSPWMSPELKATNQAILSMPQEGGGAVAASSPAASAWWKELDFNFEGSAPLLNDKDMHAVLICIDAVKRLESLKLSTCIKLKGSGLKPLRGSIVLKELELVTPYDPPSYDPCAPAISPEITYRYQAQSVIPILTSIIDAPGNVLRIISLPANFFQDGIQIVSNFLSKFADLLQEEGYECPICGNEQEPGFDDDDDDDDRYREYMYESRGTKCTGYYCVECWNQWDAIIRFL